MSFIRSSPPCPLLFAIMIWFLMHSDMPCVSLVVDVLVVVMTIITSIIMIMALASDRHNWPILTDCQGGAMVLMGVFVIVLLSIYSIRTLQRLLPKQRRVNTTQVRPINNNINTITNTITNHPSSAATTPATTTTITTTMILSPVSAKPSQSWTTDGETDVHRKTRRFIRVIRVAQILTILCIAIIAYVACMLFQ
jgi:hypothetical protein